MCLEPLDVLENKGLMNIDWQYIAGFFDGEGNISFSRHGCGSINVNIYQKRRNVLDIIVNFLQQHNIGATIYTDKRNQCTLRVIGGNKASLQFLKSIMPWLIVKKLEAQDIIRFFTLFPRMPKGPMVNGR